jgi:lipopolysaccharide/colanic/teichoic acid biosynthesis glycosyltransferase
VETLSVPPEWANIARNHPEFQALQRKLWLKYTMDRVIAAVLLVLVSPLVLLAALLIKWDGWGRPENAGPVFYTEPRISAGKIFRIVKFRTVPEKTVRWIREQPTSRSITASEPITRAGRVILNWYLDELPQLINILRGEMTVVGLRPHILDHTREEVERQFYYRLMIKAGFFGIPQARKRDPKYQRMMERMARRHRVDEAVLYKLDGLYVKKCKDWSALRLLFFDLYITARCFLVILRGGGT